MNNYNLRAVDTNIETTLRHEVNSFAAFKFKD